jgi:hypothetical protein
MLMGYECVCLQVVQRLSRGHIFQSKIQRQDIHSRLAQEPEVSLASMPLNQLTDRGFRNLPFTCNPRNLELGSCGGNFRIKSGRGCRDELHWNELVWILLMEGCRVRADPVDQLLVRRTKIRASRVRSIVSIARRRGTWVKVPCRGEGLGYDARSYGFAVAAEYLPVRLVFEQYLRERGDP